MIQSDGWSFPILEKGHTVLKSNMTKTIQSSELLKLQECGFPWDGSQFSSEVLRCNTVDSFDNYYGKILRSGLPLMCLF